MIPLQVPEIIAHSLQLLQIHEIILHSLQLLQIPEIILHSLQLLQVPEIIPHSLQLLQIPRSLFHFFQLRKRCKHFLGPRLVEIHRYLIVPAALHNAFHNAHTKFNMLHRIAHIIGQSC